MKAFDRLFDEAAPLIRQGLHQRDSPPVEGGRWPVSVVLPADQASATRLGTEMAEVEVLAGPGHFRTGIGGSMHVTVRTLEGYRHAAAQDDEVVRRYALAMNRAALQAEVIELELIGLTLTPGTVMVCGHPFDDSADRFTELLKEQLGADAWYEAGFRRDIWYANLVHFAADIAQPAGLVEWVAARRQLNLGRMVLDTAELWRFHYEDGTDGRVMRPAVMARTRMGRLGGSPATRPLPASDVVGTSNPTQVDIM
jgi:hypothetical protein